MKPGDKVRFMRSSGEGIVRKINKDTIDVEIEDGFIVPATRSELVVVAAEEHSYFKEEQEKETYANRTAPKPEPLDTGFYLAFELFNDKIYSMVLINNSNSQISYNVFEETITGASGMATGILEPITHIKIGERATDQLGNWPSLMIQCLFFSYGQTEVKEPLNKKIKFKAASLFKSKRKAPVTGKDSFLFRVDSPSMPNLPGDLATKMFDKDPGKKDEKPLQRPPAEVDLHIEKIAADHKKLLPSQILELQLNAFQKALDDAIATGMQEITFIHGVGNGFLKSHVHKALGMNTDVEFFKDARKDKFGFGATYVKLRN